VESGVSGLAPPREWDAVTTADCSGRGEDCVFLALEPDRVHVLRGTLETARCAAAALGDLLPPPYRAFARRRGDDTWAVGAVSVELASLPGMEGDELTYVATEDGERSLTLDGRPTVAPTDALEAAAGGRFPAFVLQAARVDADLWEVSVDPL
jgi:hypothetical protein